MKFAFCLVKTAVAAMFLIGCQPAHSKSPAAAGATEEKELKIGDSAPAWKDLAGTDDKKHSLKDLEKCKAVAVVFTCNSCPVAVAYEDRLIKMANDYKDKGVAVVAINVNKDAGNNLEAMKQRAEKKGFPFAYLFDDSQQIARDFGATCTPHAFLLDGKHKVVYMGAIDDDMNADNAKVHGLQDAIEAVLAGKEPTVATTKQFGCGIRYE